MELRAKVKRKEKAKTMPKTTLREETAYVWSQKKPLFIWRFARIQA